MSLWIYTGSARVTQLEKSLHGVASFADRDRNITGWGIQALELRIITTLS